MNAAVLLTVLRRRSRRSVRECAARAGTSHSTWLAYESAAKTPRVDTLDRLCRGTGHRLEVSAVTAVVDEAARAEELIQVLNLAEAFPARHTPELLAPVFPHGTTVDGDVAPGVNPAVGNAVPASATPNRR